MAKYRKRPVVVEAVQWTGENNSDVMEFTGTHIEESKEEVLTFVPLAYPNPELWVAVKETWVNVKPGEWIIGDKLGFYPCDPSVFYQTYEFILD